MRELIQDREQRARSSGEPEDHGRGHITTDEQPMQSQASSLPSLVLAGNTSADQLFSSLDAFLGTPEPLFQRPLDPADEQANENPIRPNPARRARPPNHMRLHLDLRRCTRKHQLRDAFALVHRLAGRIALLDISVGSEQQAGFGEAVTVLGKSHGLAVSVR